MNLVLRLLTTAAIVISFYSISYSIKPSRYISTSDIESEYNNVSFKKVKTHDGYKILLADIKPSKENSKNIALLICYPDSGNIKKWLGYGLVLADMGYNVVMFDYRGFGGSDPFTAKPDSLYCDEYLTDANTALNYLVKSYPTYKVGLFGMSMGSIFTTQLAVEHKADFIIGDSYVMDMDSTVSRVEKVFGKKVTLPKSSWDYNSNFSYVQQPMLVFNGRYDTICTSSMPLQNSLSEQIIYRGGYMEGPESLNKEYFTSIDKFITKVTVEKASNAGMLWFIPILISASLLIYIRRNRLTS